MFRTILKRRLCLLTVLVVSAAVTPLAYGAELILLRNGFSVECIRHEQISENRTRLFFDNSSTNFMEVDTGKIDSATVLPSEAPQSAPPLQQPTPQLPELTAMIAAAGKEHRIEAALLASVVQAESGGHTHAVSRTGAQGLMQLMPGTARELGVHDSFAPDENLRGGTTYLDRLLTRYHDDLPLALAAYNAGPAAVDRYHGVPPYRETQQYVARIIREFNRRVLLERSAASKAVAGTTRASAQTRSQ